MVAARDGYNSRWGESILGYRRWSDIVQGMDWNRILLEAQGLHMIAKHANGDVCGNCLMSVLLRQDTDL